MKRGKSTRPAEMREEYKFDYKRARPNRFADRMSGKIGVLLEPDVAAVFDSSEAVNRLLRSVIAAVPARKRRNGRKTA